MLDDAYHGIESRLDGKPSASAGHLQACTCAAAVCITLTSVVLYVGLAVGVAWSDVPFALLLGLLIVLPLSCVLVLVCVLSAGRTASRPCAFRLYFWLSAGVVFYLSAALYAYHLFRSVEPTAIEASAAAGFLLIASCVCGVEVALAVCFQRIIDEKTRASGSRSRSARSGTKASRTDTERADTPSGRRRRSSRRQTRSSSESDSGAADMVPPTGPVTGWSQARAPGGGGDEPSTRGRRTHSERAAPPSSSQRQLLLPPQPVAAPPLDRDSRVAVTRPAAGRLATAALLMAAAARTAARAPVSTSRKQH